MTDTTSSTDAKSTMGETKKEVKKTTNKIMNKTITKTKTARKIAGKTAKKEDFLFSNSSIIIVAFAILAFMFFKRSLLGGLLFGNESYYHLMLAQKIHLDPSMIFSNLYLRDYLITPFHAILAIYPKQIFAQLLSTTFALASAAAFYAVLKRIIRKDSNYAMMLLVSSTMFIYFMLFVNSDSLSVLLALIAILFYIEEKRALLISTLIILLLFPPFNLLLLLGLFLIHSEKTINQKKFRNYLLILAFLSLFIHPQIFYQYEQNKTFSDFGSYAGLSLIMVLFAVAGIFSKWKESKWYTLFFTLIFIGSYYYSNLNIYVNLYLALMGGIAISILLTYKWADKSIKTLMFLVLFSSVLFSTLAYLNFAKDAMPKSQVYDALKSVSESDGSFGKVLSLQDKSILISYFNLDPFMPVFDGSNEDAIAGEIFASRNLAKTRILFETNKIAYVFVDEDLTLYVGENEGLLFLLRNEVAFKKIYDKNGVQVWKYNKLFEPTN